MEKLIFDLLVRLEKIALKNDDHFDYCLRFRPSLRDSKVSVEFCAVERADGHDFVSGSGNSIEDAVKNAVLDIPGQLKSWGYNE